MGTGLSRRLARRVEGDSGLTKSGAIVGTPSYMAPEQARAEKQLSTAIDVYSLGAILYELLTSRPPFRGDTVLATLMAVIEKEPTAPRSIHGRVNRDLETICLKCLNKHAEKRYESAAALADDLERWLRGEPIQARPVGRAERLWRWCRRKPAVAALLAAVALVTLAGVVGITWALSEALEQRNYAQDQEKRALSEKSKCRKRKGSGGFGARSGRNRKDPGRRAAKTGGMARVCRQTLLYPARDAKPEFRRSSGFA